MNHTVDRSTGSIIPAWDLLRNTVMSNKPCFPIFRSSHILLRFINYRMIIRIKWGDSGSVDHIILDTVSFQWAGFRSILTVVVLKWSRLVEELELGWWRRRKWRWRGW